MRTVDLVADFLAAQRGRRAANTIAAYRSDLHRFARTLSGPVEGIVAADLEKYLAAIPDVTKTTLARHQASLRALFAWGYRLERLAMNPMVRLEGIRGEDHLPRPLDAPDIARILAAIPSTKLRDRLLFTLLRDTGIRVGEALSIRWEDISLDDGDEQARVLGKGGRERTVLLHAAPETVRLLRRYKKGMACSGYLFQGDPRRGGGGAPLDYSSVRYAWNRYCAHAGVMANPPATAYLRHGACPRRDAPDHRATSGRPPPPGNHADLCRGERRGGQARVVRFPASAPTIAPALPATWLHLDGSLALAYNFPGSI